MDILTFRDPESVLPQSCGKVRCSELPGSAVTTNSAAPPYAAVAWREGDRTKRDAAGGPPVRRTLDWKNCATVSFGTREWRWTTSRPDALVAEAMAVNLQRRFRRSDPATISSG